jgi:chromate transporter
MLNLFLAFLKVGAASYGGGWTIVGIIRTEILSLGWLTPDDFARLVAVAQVTPGPVALNAATMVGFRLFGLAGAAIATLAVVAVPVTLALTVGALMSRMAKRGRQVTEALKTGTIGLIAMTVWAFAPAATSSWLNAVTAIVAFSVSAFTRINPLWVILGSGIIGAARRAIFG